MKAILLKDFGGVDQLYFGEYATPIPTASEVLVSVQATALNRADLMQRKGHYPPPKGASPILGLEMAGVIEKVGAAVSKWKVGDRVCGLLPGGGYAEYAILDENMAIPIPEGTSFEAAAAIPEVFLTAFQALVYLAKAQKGEVVLIHAGASGVGTAAIQLCKQIGAIPIVTASPGKHELCKSLGAVLAIDYRTEDFVAQVKDYTAQKGVDVIIDFIGAPYWQKNVNSLALEGRLVQLAMMGGVKVEHFDMRAVLLKRLQFFGSTLRSRTLAYKIKLTQDFQAFTKEAFEKGELKPVIDSVFPWTAVAEAHEYMEANKNKGKIILNQIGS